MYGPQILVEFERKDKKQKPMTIELCAPKDITDCAKKMAKWLDNRTRLFMRMGAATEEMEIDWYRNKATESGICSWSFYADGSFIGGGGFHDIDLVHRNAEMGILLADKEHWGKGIAAVVEIAMIEYAFNALSAEGLHKLVAYVYVSDRGDGNDASRAVLEKVGFKDAGIMHQHKWIQGRWYDVWIGELLQEEWNKIKLDCMKACGITKLDLYPGCADKGYKPIIIS